MCRVSFVLASDILLKAFINSQDKLQRLTFRIHMLVSTVSSSVFQVCVCRFVEANSLERLLLFLLAL